MKKIKYILLIFIFLLVGCKSDSDDSDKLTIISTSFPGYDFARAIVGDNMDVSMLISPGTEVHSYDPSPKDIINIQNSDIFIYVGGESESWVDDILSSLDTSKMTIIRLMDYVDLSNEEVKEGMEVHSENDEEEYDEHIWTSPKNAIKLVEVIYEVISKKDVINSEIYLNNKESYISELQLLDEEITEIVYNSKRQVLIFGDRFPFKYFVDSYNLDYYAAFSGCSSETEASAKTVAFLIDKVRLEKIPVVFYLEMSNHKIADIIADETGVKTLEFHSIHNLTKDDFEAGYTYVDIMKRNISNLKEALE